MAEETYYRTQPNLSRFVNKTKSFVDTSDLCLLLSGDMIYHYKKKGLKTYFLRPLNNIPLKEYVKGTVTIVYLKSCSSLMTQASFFSASCSLVSISEALAPGIACMTTNAFSSS